MNDTPQQVTIPEFAEGLTFEEYSALASETAIYPGRGEGNIVYPTLGLTGEAGEIAEKVKKIIRDDDGNISPEQVRDLARELGDVLWYINALATELNIPLPFIAAMNVAKLQSRQQRDQLQGSGDDR